MKKILVFALIAVMLFSMAACGRKNNEEMPNDTTTQNGDTTNDMPSADQNVPDPEVNGNSTDNKDATGNHDQGGMLDDAMDQVTGQE